MKRIRWTYEAEFDYIGERENPETKEKGLIVGFLEEDGTPYECPTTYDEKMVERIKKLDSSPSRPKWVRVTVEINDKKDELGREFPTIIAIKPLKR